MSDYSSTIAAFPLGELFDELLSQRNSRGSG
jgi:hypothetical protein